MNESQTDRGQTTYVIGGITYRLEPLSWQQCQWLGEHIFHDIDIQALDYAVIHDLLRQKGPLFMAICLLAEGQTRAQQATQPFSAIQALASRFAGELTGGEVALFGPHFFGFCQPAQLAMLIPGRVLQQQYAEIARSVLSGADGSSPASSPSATETVPVSASSSVSGDRETPSRISGAASNGARSMSGS